VRPKTHSGGARESRELDRPGPPLRRDLATKEEAMSEWSVLVEAEASETDSDLDTGDKRIDVLARLI
jgi:hypothetical protein